MREIIFRGKRIDNNEWAYGGFTIHSWLKKYLIFNYSDKQICHVDPLTVGQFTGLSDINNVKIFEGDIVKYYQPYAKRTDIHIVKWDDLWAGFGLFEKNNKWCKESDWQKIQSVEVLGNVYENPELINNQS